MVPRQSPLPRWLLPAIHAPTARPYFLLSKPYVAAAMGEPLPVLAALAGTQRLLADLRAQHKTSGLLARQGSSPIAPQYSATGVLLLYQTFPAAFTSAYALPANHRTATAPLLFWQAAVRVSPHNCPCSDGLGQPLFTATTAYKLPPSVTNSTQHPSMTAAPDAVASISKRLHGFRVS